MNAWPNSTRWAAFIGVSCLNMGFCCCSFHTRWRDDLPSCFNILSACERKHFKMNRTLICECLKVLKVTINKWFILSSCYLLFFRDFIMTMSLAVKIVVQYVFTNEKRRWEMATMSTEEKICNWSQQFNTWEKTVIYRLSMYGYWQVQSW